jgi:hypothetical protein
MNIMTASDRLQESAERRRGCALAMAAVATGVALITSSPRLVRCAHLTGGEHHH